MPSFEEQLRVTALYRYPEHSIAYDYLASFTYPREALDGLRGEGKASVLAADANGVIGILGLADAVRPEAAAVSACPKWMAFLRPFTVPGRRPAWCRISPTSPAWASYAHAKRSGSRKQEKRTDRRSF